MKVDQITRAIAEHGEGPLWHPRDGLCIVDMLAGDVLRLDTSSESGPSRRELDRWHVGDVAAVVRAGEDGSYVIATRNAFVWAERFGGPVSPIAAAFDDPAVRFNDGGCDPSGNFLAGTMAYDEEAERGFLCQLDPDGRVDRLFGKVTISNGLCWTRDGTRAFYTDSATQRVDVFDWDADHGLRNRRPFARIAADLGAPDGLTVDSADGVWVALWGGGRIHHYTADGELDAVVRLPVPKVTACTFGGADLNELYITTSRYGESTSADYPSAGAVFRTTPAIGGFPQCPFRRNRV
jgi:sugar lactone lactonase YvrE